MTVEQRRSIWLDRLSRFQQTSQTVAAFCELEGVSVPSFYNWKRRLGDEAQHPSPTDAQPRFAELKIVGEPLSETSRRNTARATLVNGVQIDLGENLPVVAVIIEQLLQHQNVSNASNDKASSC